MIPTKKPSQEKKVFEFKKPEFNLSPKSNFLIWIVERKSVGDRFCKISLKQILNNLKMFRKLQRNILDQLSQLSNFGLMLKR